MGERADALGQPDRDIMDREPARSAVPEDEATTEELRSDIEQTRADMGETIDALQEKLSPEHLREQAKEAAREATIGKAEEMVQSARMTAQETRATLMETIRHNPVPAALVGLGLGWLWMNRRSAPSHQYQWQQGRGAYYTATGQRGYSGMPEWDQGWRQPTGGQERSPGQLLQQGQQAVSHTVSQAGETAGQVASEAQAAAGQMADQAQWQAQRLEDQFEQMMREQPLAMGAVALALGTAVGLLVPETRQERQYLGEASDRLMERAQATAKETVQKVQRVAEEAQATVQQEAREQGLSH